MPADPDWEVNAIEQALLHGDAWRSFLPGEKWTGWAQRVGPTISPEAWGPLLRRAEECLRENLMPHQRALLDWYHCDTPGPFAVER